MLMPSLHYTFYTVVGNSSSIQLQFLTLKTFTFLAEEICGLISLLSYRKGAYDTHQQLKSAFKPMLLPKISLNHLPQIKFLSFPCKQSLFSVCNKSYPPKYHIWT